MDAILEIHDIKLVAVADIFCGSNWKLTLKYPTKMSDYSFSSIRIYLVLGGIRFVFPIWPSLLQLHSDDYETFPT